jgi:hypothetical protein
MSPSDRSAKQAVRFAFLLLAMGGILTVRPCSISPKPATHLSAPRAVIITGQITDVLCPACDTVIDTTRFDLKVDTSTGLAIEKKIKRFNHFKTLQQIERYKKAGSLSADSTWGLSRSVNCEACELVITPLDAFALPPNVTQVSVYLYDLDAQCRSVGIRLADRQKYLGKYVTLVGQLEQNAAMAEIIVATYSISSYLSLAAVNKPEELLTAVDYRTAMHTGFKNLNLILELGKDLVRLDRARTLVRKKEIVRNLMYHKFYLQSPDSFRQMLEANLSQSGQKTIEKLAAEQKRIAAAWRAERGSGSE